MSNPRERVTQATHIDRCYALSVMNPIEGRKLAIFQEQTLVQLGDRTIVQEAGSCALEFEADGEFPAIDPATDEPTGQVVTHAQLYAMLHSAYRHAAQQRDLALQQQRLAAEAAAAQAAK